MSGAQGDAGGGTGGDAQGAGGGLGVRLFIWFQYLLPQHGLSRLVLAATRVRVRWFKNALIRGFLEFYRVDMSDAAEPDPCRYASFNEFFTRALKAGARPIAGDADSIACPVDGRISEAGIIEDGRLLQAKGRRYGLAQLLAGQPWAGDFEGGSFATIYLAPFNYHRVHMPIRGQLQETVYVPGRLFSVNAVTARHVPNLFARNERVLTLFDTAHGRFALVLVGALNVGSMATVWSGDITPAARRVVARIPSPPIALERGAELGRFNMGSTVILLFQRHRAPPQSGSARRQRGAARAVPGRPDVNWRPTASLETLRARAAMLRAARDYFAARGVLEVETPILSNGAVSDPQIESLSTRVAGSPSPLYLCTSPEYAMKRLLAAGSGDIYQICKVFRDEERGRWHNPEFTLIEWYRVGMDDAQLMTEVEALIGGMLAPHRRIQAAERLSYSAALERHAGVDAHAAHDDELTQAAARHGIVCRAELDRDAKLDLLMGFVVAPRLGFERPCFIVDYPASQASLARLKPGLPPVAARFELFLDGIELANGFHELMDGREQRGRFAQDLRLRRTRGQAQPPLDERMLAALEAGLPDCAGVALGFDRLAALAIGAPRLADAMAFSIDDA